MLWTSAVEGQWCVAAAQSYGMAVVWTVQRVNKIYRLSDTDLNGNQICSLVLGDKLLHHWNVEMLKEKTTSCQEEYLSQRRRKYICVSPSRPLHSDTQCSLGGHVSLYGPFSTASLSSVSLCVLNKLSVFRFKARKQPSRVGVWFSTLFISDSQLPALKLSLSILEVF